MNRRPALLFFSVASCIAMVSFQNCGQLLPLTSAVNAEASLETQYQKGLAIVGQMTSSTDLSVWISAKESTMSYTTATPSTLALVSSLNSAGAAAGSSTGLSVTPGSTPPSLVTSTSGFLMFSLPGTTTLVTSLPEQMISTAAAFVAVVAQPMEGVLMSVSASTLVEAFTIEYASGTVTARHYYDANNYETLSASAGGSGAPLVIAASYGNQLGRLALQINGKTATGQIINQGAPIAPSLLAREFALGDSFGPVGGQLQVGEVMVFTSTLTLAQMNTLSRYMGDKWNLSVAYDPSLYPPDPTVDSNDIVPTVVQQMLTTNCTTSCHTHAAWSSYRVSDFKTTLTSYGAHLVVAGSPLSSEMYTRIKGSDGTPVSSAGKSMPADGNVVSASDLAVLKNWIVNMK